MVNGINFNPAALAAINNSSSAGALAERSISRLSSGNQIIKAKYDVAGLAVGTILKTNISTLRAALTNASQAQSLLGVADGALDNIGQILQRQKALSSQATSGSLTDQARGYLNDEFQNLSLEIDRISKNVNFNGISLLDGSLYNTSSLKNSTSYSSNSVSTTINFATAVAAGQTIQLFSSDTTAPQGVSRDFTTGGFIATPFTSKAAASQAAYPGNLVEFDGTTQATAAQNFLNMVNNLMSYTGDDQPTLRAKGIVAQFNWSISGSTVTMTANSAGQYMNMSDIVTPSTAGTLKINGIANTASQTIALSSTGIAGIDGDLHSGGFPSLQSGTATAYSNDYRSPGIDATTIAQGQVADPLIASLTPTASYTTGINLSGISNNPDFIGRLPNFVAEYVSDNSVNLKLSVGGVDYIANGVNTLPANSNSAVNEMVTFYSVSNDANYGTFTLQFANGQGTAVTDKASLATYTERLNTAFNRVDVFQRRPISSYDAAGTVFPVGSQYSTTANGSLAGSKFWMINNDFSSINLEAIEVTAPLTPVGEASISLRINGETFVSGYEYDGSTMTTPFTTLSSTGGVNGDGKYGFVSQTNPGKMLIMQYASSIDYPVTSISNAEGLQRSLAIAFGFNTGTTNNGLSFQVGTSSTDVIEVQIQGAETKDLFVDSITSAYVELSVDTKEKATVAQKILDTAIQTISTIRAQVGSFQSRLDFATSSINSSIENLESARSLFLDADISAESTSLAQSSLKLQAGIAMLAQANQRTGLYLKLLG